VLEAAAAGLKQIRETEMIEDEGVVDLTVDLVTTTSHREMDGSRRRSAMVSSLLDSSRPRSQSRNACFGVTTTAARFSVFTASLSRLTMIVVQ